MSGSRRDTGGIGAFDLSGKVAIVTGASRGLGRAIALGLVSAGARMVVGSRQVAQLDSVVEAITSGGGEVEPSALTSRFPTSARHLSLTPNTTGTVSTSSSATRRPTS